MSRFPVMLQDLFELEKVVQYWKAPPAGEPYFSFSLGQVPMLISAPHGAAHMRNGKKKIEDEYTTAFARYLARETGCFAIYGTHFSPHEDPNWDEEGAYKQTLARLVRAHDIRFVLDLHGMTSRYQMGLALGSRKGVACPRLLPVMTASLEKHGYERNMAAELPPVIQLDWEKYLAGEVDLPKRRWDNYVIDHPRFTGGVKNHTVTRYVNEKLGLPALQLEISSQIRVVERDAHGPWDRVYRGYPAGIEHTLRALTDMVDAVISAL